MSPSLSPGAEGPLWGDMGAASQPPVAPPSSAMSSGGGASGGTGSKAYTISSGSSASVGFELGGLEC